MIKGKIRESADLIIEGNVEGSIISKYHVKIGKTGIVKANIHAGSVTIIGEIDGDVVATNEVLIKAGSRVNGIVRASQVIMEEGVRFSGDIKADKLWVYSMTPLVKSLTDVRISTNPKNHSMAFR